MNAPDHGNRDQGPTRDAPRPSKGLRRATGRDRDEWFGLLDGWGAPGRAYRDIADWLTSDHAMSSWWAQKVIVEYQEARGLRDPGIRRDGTFEITASKVVAVPVERLFAAFADAELRARWLPGVAMRERMSQPGRSLRFDCEGGATRVVVSFTASGEGKSQVALQHEHLPDVSSADEKKAYWRERLAALKTELER